MKNVLKGILLGVLLVTAISAVTVYRIRDIQGDKPGNKTLWEELRDRYTKGEADTTFVKVADGFELRDSVWFKGDTITSVTMPAETNTIAVATTGFVQGEKGDHFLKGLQAVGSPIKALVIGSYGGQGGGNFGLVDGTRYFQRIYVEKQTTITGIAYTLQTQGAFTGDNFNGVALYSGTGATLTRVATSANSANIWKTASNAPATVAFTSPYVAAPGVYTVVLLYNSSAATTTPAIYSSSTWSSNMLEQYGFTAGSGKFIYGTQSGQTDLPETITSSGITASNILISIFAY